MSQKTERLFESNSYQKEFEAKVIEIRALSDGQGIVLDKTLFYPEGGGQASDRGQLNGYPVTSVTEEGQTIIHSINGSFSAGERVKGKIDWERRFDHMQQHTGQHLLSQVFIRMLNADTISFHLGSEDVTIDLNLGEFSQEDVAGIETETNRIIYENRNVRIYNKTLDSLDSIPLRKRPVLKGPFRIVEIDQFDWSLCCGTHVQRTGEIGAVKILRWERFKGGIRVHFLCGWRALRDYQIKTGIIKSVSQLLTAGENEIAHLVSRWKEDRKMSEKEINILRDRVLEEEASHLLRDAKPVGLTRWVTAVFRERDTQEVQRLVHKTVQADSVVAVVGAIQEKATVYFACSENVNLNMRLLQESAAKDINGKGGGGTNWAQCSTTDIEKVEFAIKRILDSQNIHQ